jgi:orotidine-5'-phosphate decarboxylase
VTSRFARYKSTLRTGEKLLPDSFSKKLESAFLAKGQLCVGIDPHESLLIENGFDNSAQGVQHFSLKMLDQLQDQVSIIKPQVSIFERFGSEGFAALESVLEEANQRGFLVIADAKRGDIGSTMEAYGQAWLAKSAPFVCDALTVNPYLGVGALSSAVAFASDRGKGLFVLAATSNEEGKALQSSMHEGLTVAAQVAREVQTLNKNTATSNTRFGSVGLVVGATVNLKQLGLDTLNAEKSSLRTTILAPGFGFQGADLSRAKDIFGELSGDVIYTVSRSALRNGIESVGSSARQDQETLKIALAQ